MLMLTAIMLFRFVATELATDIVISIGDVKFYLHKVSISKCFTHYQLQIALKVALIVKESYFVPPEILAV